VRGLLAEVVTATVATATPAVGRLQRFLDEPDPWKALALWVGTAALRPGPETTSHLARLLNQDIARLDGLLSRQVNAILHHPQFQKLEASWRGLRYLVNQLEESENIRIRILNVSWKELVRDVTTAIEFDQSQLFRKVYSEEFGSPGGIPFGVLLGDYEVRHRPGPDHPSNDVEALEAVSHVAAAAFAPFVTSAEPVMFGLDHFTELELPLNLPRTFEQMEYLKWRAFREQEDARFVALALPRVLMRLPYPDDGSRADGFRFREDVSSKDRSDYLWGNAVYAFGAVLVRSFTESGWLANIRGVPPGEIGGGMVTGLPAASFGTDAAGVAFRSCTDAMVTDHQEKELSELGFLPLSHCPDTEIVTFYGSQSVQKPKKYDDPSATANARVSAFLQYMLSVSRFAHYVKVIFRDKIGAFRSADECEDFLNRWITNYVTAADDISLEVKARYPLREARIQVRDHPGKPGSYLCVAHLRPHFQLEEMVTTVRLTTELARPGN
jgi:type VI secretion system ImpC/EvpB family protein